MTKYCVKGEDIIKQNNHKVYFHKNKFNRKIYVGMTSKELKARWGKGWGYINNKEFYNDIRKISWDNFEHIVVGKGLTKEEAEYFEMLLIEKLETRNPEKGYNIQIGGYNSNRTLCRGKSKSAKKVICNNIIFDCARDCADFYGIKAKTMRQWLIGANGMPKKFIEYNLHYVDGDYEIRQKKENNKKVICDNIIFNSLKECSEYYDVKYSTLKAWLSGRNNIPQKFIDFGLRLM